MKKLSDVQNAEEMIAFLQKKGCNHYNYYHYTDWDSLNKIVKNRTFLLTRGKVLSSIMRKLSLQALRVKLTGNRGVVL